MANRTRDTANLVSANNLYVDISTDKVGIGTTTPTSKLTVVGDVLVSGILTASRIVGTSLSISGISTIANFIMTPVGTGATVGGIGVTYYGDGLNLTGIVTSIVAGTNITISGSTGQVTINSSSSGGGSISISTNTENQSQYITYVAGTGNTTGLGVTIGGLVFNPASGNLGIGTVSPAENLHIHNPNTSLAVIRLSGSAINQTPFNIRQGIVGTNNGGFSIYDVNNSATRFAIDPSGNIGISTTLPTSKLDVRGDVSIASTLGIGTVIDIVPYDTLNSGTLSWEGSAGQLFSITNNLTTGSIYSVNDVSGIPSIDVDANGTIQLGPYGGNIGLGTTNPTAKLHVVGDVRVSGASTFVGLVKLDSSLRDIYGAVGAAGSVLISTGAGVSWSASTPSAAAVTISNDNETDDIRYPMFENITSGTVETVNVSSSNLQFNPFSGTLFAKGFTSLSDRTQKEDIRPIENAIGIVNQLTGVRYNWKNNTNKPSIGLIAQDVEEVIPEVVVEMADGLKSVSYGNIVAVLIEAIKEQQVRIEELEDRLNA